MRDWFTKDFGWKLFSFFLALGIWLTIHQIYEEPKTAAASVAGDKVTYGNLPVLVVSTAEDVRDFRVMPAVVSVTVSGSPEIMAVLQANQIRAVVDLTDIESGRGLRRKIEISMPPGVTLMSVEPSIVDVVVPPAPGKK
jgi:YbbR domain-containing protein